MIKGSTKVGEIFMISGNTGNVPVVQSQFLGKAITGLGGGCQKLYVIEEGDGYQGILNPLHPFDQGNEQYHSGAEDDNKSAIVITNSATGQNKQPFHSSPFEQQQNFYQIQKPPLTNVDQRIEERESLRHSTHRSQRSERLGSHHGGNMQHTATERFGNTDYNNDHIERPNFQGQTRGDSQQHHIYQDGDEGHAQQQEEGSYIDMQHQIEQNHEVVDGDEEPSKMFTFDENNQQQMIDERQSQRSGGQGQQNGKQFQGAPSRTQQQQQQQVEGGAGGSMGHLLSVASGRNHSLHLTRDGDVFSYGSGQYSAVGHGGSRGQLHPTVLKPLRDKRIVQIACGEHHSLVLTDKADIFAWGRGFEGQLGLSKSIEIASTPQYVKSFYGKPVIYIAAGAFYSLAITKDGSIWGWGEAKMGQLGCGKQREVRLPTKINFEHEQGKNFVQCSAGYGHSSALNDQGMVFTWGFNNYGQLGQMHNKTSWIPCVVNKFQKDQYDEPAQLPPIQKIKCSYYATFLIDINGKPYSTGKAPIGLDSNDNQNTFMLITENIERRIFTDVFTNENSVVLYAPIRVDDVYPRCGPASGNTQVQIFGTGFVNSDKLKVRYSYGDLSQEVTCLYDHNQKCLIAKTPKFEEFEGEKHPSLKFPCNCIISVTMDGIHYSECEEVFKIYSNDIYLTSINPKCGSVVGGTTLTLLINIDEVTAGNLSNLTIGFQPKKNSGSSLLPAKKFDKGGNNQTNARSHQSLNESNKSSAAVLTRSALQNYQDQIQNAPNDTVNGEDENTTTSPGWTCSRAQYENGTITCTVPNLTNYDQDSLQFNVDVALNGQQFTGKPLQFRYYDIHIERVEPGIGPSEGGTVINIIGGGLYDSASKRVKFQINEYERVVTAQWERKLKCLQCIVPPLTWLFGGVELTEEQLEKIKQTPIRVWLTFNNQEWIEAKEFKYHDCKVERIAYALGFGTEIADPIEREKLWRAEEPLEKYPDEMPADEIKKREDEKAKKALEETEESQTVAKRKGYKIFIYGHNFVKQDVNNKQKFQSVIQALRVKFSHVGTGVSKEVQAFYRNSKKVGCEIPDMGGEVPVGQHLLIVEVSLNGQQYTSNGMQFLYNSVDPNLSEEELKKLDEMEEKNSKKPAPKKK